MTSPVDYSTFFEFPELTRIHGQPTFDSLTRLSDQLKSNAQSVISDLGGGSHGHLGLVLSPDEYATISPVPYVAPPHPGALQIPVGTAQHVAIRLKEEHRENIRVFRESLDVQQALIKQIVTAVDEEYLQELRNETTNAITADIPTILAHLTLAYGEVDSEDLKKKEDDVLHYTWNLNEPPADLFNRVESLSKAAIAAGLPKSQAQLIDYGLHVIKKTSDFENALGTWYDRPLIEKTWLNFKLHFSLAHRKLKKVRGTTVRNTTFHQVNQIAAKLSDDIATMKVDVLSRLNNWNDRHHPSSPVFVSQETLHADGANTMNATVDSNAELLRLIQQLQSQVNDLSTQSHLSPPSARRPLRPRRNIGKYCWTHGACSHDGKDCKNKAPGHRDDATFSNKLGGSTYYCQPTPSPGA